MDTNSEFIPFFKVEEKENLPIYFYLLRSIDCFNGVGKAIHSPFHSSDSYVIGYIRKPISNLI